VTNSANGAYRRYLNVAETGERFHLSQSEIRDLARRGLIPHRRLPYARRLLFEPAWLDAWVDGAALERIDLPGNGRIVRPVGVGE
jgi:hypothetical protein